MSAASKRKPAREQITLEFPDNALLANLSGAHQRNFVRLEQKLGVRLAMRGNLVSIAGPHESRARAASVLRALYSRLQTGERAEPLIRHLISRQPFRLPRHPEQLPRPQ